MTRNKKKVLVLCPYPKDVAPSQRLKYEQYIQYIEDAGYKVSISPFISRQFWKIVYKKGNLLLKIWYTLCGYFRRTRDLFRIPFYDVIYVHLWVTPLGPPIFEWLVNKLARKVIYDIDDLIYLKNHNQANALISSLKGKYKPIYLIKSADHVITCTPYLDSFVKKYNDETTDISSTINTDTYIPKDDYRIKDKLVIGWSGSHSTMAMLRLLDETFQCLSKELDFKLIVMGAPDYHLEGVNYQAIPWKEEYEVETLRSFDIGVYPLPDEEWVLGKSGLKALQYMALGVPTVATGIGTIYRIINHGENGFIVDSKESWVQAIRALAADESLRRTVGSNAVTTVRDQFSLKANKSKYIDILDKLTGPEHLGREPVSTLQ